MKTHYFILAILALAFKLSADPTTNLPPLKIGANEAVNFYDKEMTVTGKVAQVTIRPSIVFLNLDKPHPASPFTLVIFSDDTNKFGDLKVLEGQDVEATGKIKNYHDKPEMVLVNSNQLKVLPSDAAKSQL